MIRHVSMSGVHPLSKFGVRFRQSINYFTIIMTTNFLHPDFSSIQIPSRMDKPIVFTSSYSLRVADETTISIPKNVIILLLNRWTVQHTNIYQQPFKHIPRLSATEIQSFQIHQAHNSTAWCRLPLEGRNIHNPRRQDQIGHPLQGWETGLISPGQEEKQKW